MRVLIATSYTPFQFDEIRQIAETLANELQERGHQTDIVSLPLETSQNKTADHVMLWRSLDLTESSGNRIDLMIPTDYPAYSSVHPNKVIWLLREKPAIYEDEDGALREVSDPVGDQTFRDAVIKTDTLYLREARKVFASTEQIARHVQKFNGLTVNDILCPPESKSGWEALIKALVK
jgi:hypothetical protein